MQQPGEHAILAHGHHRAIEAVVFARVGVTAIGLHLVGGAGVVGGHIIYLRLDHVTPLAKSARGCKNRDHRHHSSSGNAILRGGRGGCVAVGVFCC